MINDDNPCVFKIDNDDTSYVLRLTMTYLEF